MRRLLLSLAFVPIMVHQGIPTMCYRGHTKIVKVDPKQEKCLATMIYGEARGEAEKGMVAVAYTAVNRAVNKTVCGVVLSPKQYSIFNNNPALKAAAMSLHLEPKQKNIIDKESWKKALAVAKIVIRKEINDPTNGATHYLAPTVMKLKRYKYPQWSKEYKLLAVIDNHRFYKIVDKQVAKS